jgi:cyclohexanone monooxygenase
MPTAVVQHVDWIADCMTHMREQGLTRIEPGQHAQADWVAHVVAVADGTLYANTKSWYLASNIPGKPRQFRVCVGGFAAYKQRCKAVAGAGYEGFELESA